MINKCILYKTASEDIESILNYISIQLKNPEAAVKLIQKFEAKFKLLLEFPESYPTIDDIHLKMNNLHKCIIDHYVIIYAINKEKSQLEIIRIIYERFDISRMIYVSTDMS